VNTFFLLLGAGIVDGAILAPACVGLSLQFGVTNYVNFAYGSVLTFSAFLFWTFNTNSALHWNLWVAGIAAAICTGVGLLLIGAFIYEPFFRRRQQLLYALVVTFAIGLMLQSLFAAIWGASENVLNYPNGVATVHDVGPFVFTTLELIFVCVSVVTLCAVFALLGYTRLGRTMRAVADDNALAVVCGLPVRRTINATWGISGFLAGIAGVVLALQSYGFDASLGNTFLYLVFTAVIIGGIGRTYGSVIGAVIIGIVFQLSGLVIGSGLSVAAVFAVLIVIMLVRPDGLFGATGRTVFQGA
jgi:branched-subunit amino acid ABC-type transport system permease component